MANNPSSNNPKASGDDVFDIDRVRKFVELMKEHELSEIDLRHEDKRIRLRSGSETTFVTSQAMPAPAASAATVPAASTPAAPPAVTDTSTVIKSPMVGTFYLSAKPGDPPFVKIGDHVTATQTVCIIEAMKMFNEIPAGVSGKIVAIVARNEEPVDVGRPLFRIAAD
jgi:acetyl-CoA carboxylase biotin carboxyl carrier protein